MELRFNLCGGFSLSFFMRQAVFFVLLLLSQQVFSECWTIARLKYQGGGDWYSNPTSLPNLFNRLKKDLKANICPKEETVELLDAKLFEYPILYLTGHGKIHFSDEERKELKKYLYQGGLLIADDNYGLDASFRQEIKEIWKDNKLYELGKTHPVFSAHYVMKKGMPKVHEHDGKRPQLLAIDVDGRPSLLYSYEADLGDGWENQDVHNVPEATRELALKMGVNIVAWYLQGQPGSANP